MELERLLDEYGDQELSFAIQEALDRGTSAPSAVAQILEQERRKKRVSPPLRIDVSDDPRVRDLRVKTPTLGDYDDLAE